MTATQEEREAIRREAQLVAHTLRGGIVVYEHKCWNCQEQFMSNADYAHLCSDRCLAQFLESYDIIWLPEADPEKRWDIVPPALISPSTLRRLRTWAGKLIHSSS